jgi:hypothetical protein
MVSMPCADFLEQGLGLLPLGCMNLPGTQRIGRSPSQSLQQQFMD